MAASVECFHGGRLEAATAASAAAGQRSRIAGGHAPRSNIRNAESAYDGQLSRPATSFCEWTDSKPKVPHWFGPQPFGAVLFVHAPIPQSVSTDIGFADVSHARRIEWLNMHLC